ncbi:tyrosine-type recombinase/integrase [Pseudoalteromonas denitrificans]|uniref:Phage integrase family protein n=1 Tax=Pseudoalteromonas denitrificans DSM 6059 TaxID=1123010 RepID=A0A1I1QCT6_9GAMM|nr:tyrosine-type recombinase/integrase [Pseudoalteromonas denitrificans]SFD17638.1 Phage integrase family protein [Pseudoalteromonas denitrificans DSM 6059]
MAIDDELQESSNEYYEFLAESFNGIIVNPNTSLKDKLIQNENKDFLISENSYFREERWNLLERNNFITKQVLFNSDISGSNFLKKCITYYYIPDFNPYNTIRSFESTVTFSNAHVLVEKYLFEFNCLSMTPEHILIITADMINRALDKARDQGAQRHYTFLFSYICFWISLSQENLLPESVQLDVQLKKIDTKARRIDIQNEIVRRSEGWSSYSEDDLETMLNYASFWCDKALPNIIVASQYANELGLYDKNHKEYLRSQGDKTFEDLFGFEIDGKKIIGYTKSIRNITSGVNKYKYEQCCYGWRSNLKASLDNVRDGIYIIYSLLTGLRRKEIGVLEFKDVFYESSSREWRLDITRFKTSLDPNYFGDSDSIPLPAYLGELVSDFYELKNYFGEIENELIFATSTGKGIYVENVERLIGNINIRLRKKLKLDQMHSHKSRKTIAEILINRSEKNIDLIRLLFGHHSYAMTLKYIARNPYLVEAIASTLEIHFTEEFSSIISGIINKKIYSQQNLNCPELKDGNETLFKGKVIKIAIFEYISYLLKNGQPIFISKTLVGAYCFNLDPITSKSTLPCIINDTSKLKPNPNNCKLGCPKLLFNEKGVKNIEDNIEYYSDLLSEHSSLLTKAQKIDITKKISINRSQLLKIMTHNETNHKERITRGC